MDAGKIKVRLSQDKIHQTKLKYWKEAALERALDLNDANKLKDLAPLSLCLVREAAKNVKKMNSNEIICCLKSQYVGDENQVAFIQRYTGEQFLDESHLKNMLKKRKM